MSGGDMGKFVVCLIFWILRHWVIFHEYRVVGEEQRLDSTTLQFLKDEALAFDTQEDLAALAADEGDIGNDDRASEFQGSSKSPARHSGGIANGERFICYMCYETHDTPADPLVAPCECKGDTRYLHVQCLQKWYHSSVSGAHAQVLSMSASTPSTFVH
jgi:RING-variant domain